jgi:hypothetical protein
MQGNMWLFSLNSTGSDSLIASFGKSGDLWRTLISLQKLGIPKKRMPNPYILISHSFKNDDVRIFLVSFELYMSVARQLFHLQRMQAIEPNIIPRKQQALLIS